LQAGGWTDDQLAKLQRQWEGLAVLATAEASIAMERAREPIMIQEMRTSPQDNTEIWNDFLVNTRSGIREVFTEYPRYWGWRWIWSYQEEQRYLEFVQSMIDVTRDAQKGRPVLSRLKETNEHDSPFLPVARNLYFLGPEIGVTESFVRRALGAQTEANIVATAIALARFHLAHHAYPVALANLVPEFLSAVPIDCMDSHDLHYHLNSDGTYLLYSVGDDGVDNGGDASPKEGFSTSFWLHGRDLVWPRPATEAEVRAYEAEQAKPKTGTKRQ
jgi:hypothetical protein